MVDRVNLLSISRPDLSVTISAYVDPLTKNLVFEGQDCGKAISDLQGDSDYEYWLTIQAQDKRRLLENLLESGFEEDKIYDDSDDLRLISELKARFGGHNKLISEVEEYCKENGIRTEFHSF